MQSAPANLTVLDGKDATVACRAVGAPTPNVTWYFNGTLRKYIVKCSYYSIALDEN